LDERLKKMSKTTSVKKNMFRFDNGFEGNVIFVTVTNKLTGETVRYEREVPKLVSHFERLLMSHGAKQKISDHAAGVPLEERMGYYQAMIEQLTEEIWKVRKPSDKVTMSRAEYEKLVDTVLRKYKAVKSIDPKEVEALNKDLKRHWKQLEKSITKIKKA